MINFSVQVDEGIENMEYVKHLLKGSLRAFATARVTFNQVETDYMNRTAEREEFEEWKSGRISL